MTKNHVDNLIVGQGLAGSLLAWHLLAQGQSVLVVDNDYANSSSTVAAGLINPVTGKRLVKTVGVDAYLPVAREVYRVLGEELGDEFFLDKPMLRLFHGQKERDRWLRRQQDSSYQPYLGDIVEAEDLPVPVYSSHGAGQQLQTGYLRTSPLLHGLREWLKQQGSYRQTDFAYSDLQLNGQGVVWREVEAHRAIFCEGYKGAENPWFEWLPFQLAKGEFLSVRSKVLLPDQIINSGRWIMPRGDGLYRVGASYEQQPLDETTSIEARDMLLGALPTFIEPLPEFEVVSQQAGVRPATADRQPFIGVHAEYSQLAIFNGFGSKGSLLIPWHVERLVEFLLDGVLLPSVVDIKRYQKPCHG